MSHYEEECRKACKWCAEQAFARRPFEACGWQHVVNHKVVKCESPSGFAWAEQQFERAEWNWKAGAEAMREAVLEIVQSHDDCGEFAHNGRYECAAMIDLSIRDLPIPEEQK